MDFALHFNDDEFLNGNSLDHALWMYREEGNGITFYTDIRDGQQPGQD